MLELYCPLNGRSRRRLSLIKVVLITVVTLVVSGCASQGTREVDTVAPVRPLEPAQQQLLDLAAQAAAREEWEAAAVQLRALLEQHPESVPARAQLAWVRQQQGHRPEAERLYREVLALDPGEARSVNNLALLVQGEGHFSEARALLLQGLEYSPDVPELHFNLAVLSELYLFDLEGALDHYRRYLQLADGEQAQVEGWIADLERRVR